MSEIETDLRALDMAVSLKVFGVIHLRLTQFGLDAAKHYPDLGHLMAEYDVSGYPVSLPHYSTDHNVCAQMRARLRQLGPDVAGRFFDALYPYVGGCLMMEDADGNPVVNSYTAFQLIDATPEQQCRAALKVMEVSSE